MIRMERSMVEAAVPLKVAGQTYRVVTSAPADELDRLAKIVEAALEEVTPKGRQPSPQALVLAAITLAHELEEERSRRLAVEARHRRVLGSLVGKIDRVLETTQSSDSAPRERPSERMGERSSERPTERLGDGPPAPVEVFVRSKSSARIVDLKRGE